MESFTFLTANNDRIRLNSSTASSSLQATANAIGIFSGDTTLLSESDIIGAIRLLWEQEGITPETWVVHRVLHWSVVSGVLRSFVVSRALRSFVVSRVVHSSVVL